MDGRRRDADGEKMRDLSLSLSSYLLSLYLSSNDRRADLRDEAETRVGR